MYEQLVPDAISADKFVLVVGNARSGTTIVGAILDSHPSMLCANESSASTIFWRGMDGRSIVQNIIDNCTHNYRHDRPSEGRNFGISTKEKSNNDIAIIGDKVWNPALLLLAGQRDLLASLQERTGTNIYLVHCVRNPFDVIATMHRRSGASLHDRAGWYAMHCEAMQILIDRGEQPIFLLRHEALLARPQEVVRQMFEWLGHRTDDDHLSAIQAAMFREPHKTRTECAWMDDLIRTIEGLCDRFGFLHGYAFDDAPREERRVSGP